MGSGMFKGSSSSHKKLPKFADAYCVSHNLAASQEMQESEWPVQLVVCSSQGNQSNLLRGEDRLQKFVGIMLCIAAVALPRLSVQQHEKHKHQFSEI